ncbi:MAG: M28 family peptidase [bacterium]|nr:M28 family peptidase [bacterium]
MCSRNGIRGAALALALALSGMAIPAAAEVPDFDADRAFGLLRAQCEMGTRKPGSPGLEELRQLIESTAEEHGLACVRLCFTATDPLGGGEIQVCNMVVSAGPSGGERLWLGAHYDTRPVCDRDPDPARRSEPLVGANDGASGVAVLLHLMEILGRTPPSAGVDFIFFDGEDSGTTGAPGTYCLGSQHLARTWQDMGSPLAAGEPRGLILLDMVGEKDLRIPMERYSLAWAAAWTRQVFDRAGQLGLHAFVPVPGQPVIDDHEPFLRAGIPAVDLIDFDFPQWHTTADTPEVCAPESLDQVGRLLLSLIYEP